MKMRNALRPVDQHQRAGSMGQADHLADRIDRSQRVRCMAEGDQLGARRQQPGELLEHELAGIVHRSDAQPRPFLFAKQLPGDDVRVVLDGGDEDLVTGADVLPSP
jgi:hypothetical protein